MKMMNTNKELERIKKLNFDEDSTAPDTKSIEEARTILNKLKENLPACFWLVNEISPDVDGGICITFRSTNYNIYFICTNENSKNEDDILVINQETEELEFDKCFDKTISYEELIRILEKYYTWKGEDKI